MFAVGAWLSWESTSFATRGSGVRIPSSPPDYLPSIDKKRDIATMNDILIVYYSLFHNTKNLALEIAKQTGGTLRELIPENNYSFDYNTAVKK